MALELLMDEAKGMSDEALMQVVQYMRFLKWEKKEKKALSVDGMDILRQPGMYRHMIKIADDFDAPLDDLKEYM
ncbi:MAG: DUF2281 domain-containing protein [Clostridia bacterium]|nr:DUF2281 domain-containing protein [Clostridia bacterium]